VIPQRTRVAHLTPKIFEVLLHFYCEGKFRDAISYGDGHINDTYLASFQLTDGQLRRYILQRINQAVFKQPEVVMRNIERVTTHIRAVVAAAGGDPARKTITLVPTLEGRSFHVSSDGNCWRLSLFIEGAQTYQRAINRQHYYHVGLTFGEFLELLRDFPVSELVETIPGFHNTPKRYQDFLEALERDPINRAHTAKSEINFVMKRETETGVLMGLLSRGEIAQRVTHNDTKIDNVMLDDATGEGVCVIDLDTVMPGLVVFDFGDAVRSGANQAAEDEPDTSKVAFDLDIFESLAHGFLDATRELLTKVEVGHLVFGAQLITLEQGIRFLTDYLNGDTYYKTQRPNQNLDRTRTQLKMVADMDAHSDVMEEIIARYR